MSKSQKKSERIYVEFYIHPNTPDKSLDNVLMIASVFCKQNKGVCIFPGTVPFRIQVTSTFEGEDNSDIELSEEEICQDGWYNVYEFKKMKDAYEFANYISLLRPVCDVTFIGGRFTGKPKLFRS